MTEAQFIKNNEGLFDEFVPRTWEPFQVVSEHTHPFFIKALVTRGTMWLTVRGDEHALKVGDVFELDYEEPHGERYGSEGASYLVARRSR
jgi:quercetin dioxygenase-like cupin family protein